VDTQAAVGISINSGSMVIRHWSLVIRFGE
jgi:hypothetical protein